MRKNLKNPKRIFLLLALVTAMCIFGGCGEGKQDEPTMSPEQSGELTELSDEEDKDEMPADSEGQESDTEDGQNGADQMQAENMRDQPAGDLTDKPSNVATDEGTTKPSDAATGESINKPSDASANEESGAASGQSSELSVDVESIGDHSVVGNKITILSSANGNNDIMVVGTGEDDKELVSVYFEEDASYVYRTIRNGGADVETREGSFSDIGVGLTLHLKGYYKGDDFYASEVIISKVILS